MPFSTIEPWLTEIKYQGVWDQMGLLKLIYKWLRDYHMRVVEKAYKHKVPNPFGEEDELKWEAERKINWYIRSIIGLEIHTWGVKDIEVVQGGKKVKLQEGRVQIVITYKLETDWNKRFGKSKFGETLKKFYERLIIRQYIDNIWEDQQHYHIYKLQRVIKEYLGMTTLTNASEGRW
jgi:hypothetical protein